MVSSRRNSRTVGFVIGGTQKGGTSALAAYLNEHPQICMARRKEVHFFDNDKLFHGNGPDYSEYHSAFYPEDSHELIGEATPIYMYWHDAPKRIWEYNSNMKWILLLRNPIERAYSHWNMERSRNADTMPFWHAIQNESERCREALPYQHRVYSYVDRGFYLEQLRRIWRYFPTTQVAILKSEYLRSKPNEALRHLCDFLEVEHLGDVEDKSVHSLPYEDDMSDRERHYLRLVFEHEIRGLERVLGWDCNAWLAGRV